MSLCMTSSTVALDAANKRRSSRPLCVGLCTALHRLWAAAGLLQVTFIVSSLEPSTRDRVMPFDRPSASASVSGVRHSMSPPATVWITGSETLMCHRSRRLYSDIHLPMSVPSRDRALQSPTIVHSPFEPLPLSNPHWRAPRVFTKPLCSLALRHGRHDQSQIPGCALRRE